MRQKHVVIPVFIPHRGCPFDCIYCNQKNISGQRDEMDVRRMKEIIEAHLASIAKGVYIEIGFYGGSFTGIDKADQLSFLGLAYEYVKSGSVAGIRLSTRPDYISLEILGYLKEYGVKTIELGVQSLDPDVLRATCRGHSPEAVYEASRIIREHGFTLGIQTMIGLPGDTREKDLDTAMKVIELSPEIVRIYPTLVIRDTFMERMYRDGRYKPLELDDAVDICAELLELYNANKINVIRIGLQATENITEGSDVVAGPFHPAFRQLVEARLMLKKVEGILYKSDLRGKKGIMISTGKSNISNVTGQKRDNLNQLKDKYGFCTVKVKTVETLGNDIEIELF